MKTHRTHDLLYLKENRYKDTKEMFKFIADIAFSDSIHDISKGSICDFGCAAGEFLYFLRSLLPEVSLEGVDVIPELLKKQKDLFLQLIFRKDLC